MSTESLFPHGDCGHRPMPWSGAYGHWACQLPHGHRGPHRFNNYTVRKGARAYGWLRYTVKRGQLALGKKLGLVRPWRVAIRHTNTKYDPCDLLALYERTRSDA